MCMLYTDMKKLNANVRESIYGNFFECHGVL